MSLSAAAQQVYSPSEWGHVFHNLPHDEALGAGAAGPGKALCPATVIPTPNGYRTLGEIQPGDEVFDERGMPCRVVAEKWWFERDVAVIRFDDGSEIVADLEHEWLSHTYAARISATRQSKRVRKGGQDQRHKCSQPKVVTTREMMGSLLDGTRANHSIRCSGPLQNPEANLPIDPYVLGVWLGDGTSNCAEFTSIDEEIVEGVRAVYPDTVKKPSAKQVWSVRGGLWRDLRVNRLRNNKHIPQEYFRSSASQRLALVQGLVDTDGHVDRDGRVELTLCDKQLAYSAYILVCSLGLKATIRESAAKLYGREVGRRFRICFSPQGMPVARLTRKLKKLGTGTRTQRVRYVKSITPCGKRTVKCIQVDSPSHLFLAGVQCVPTHNSMILLMEPFQQIALEHERCLDKDHPHHIPWGTSLGWALHIRRTRPMLELSIQRSHRIFPLVDKDAKWNENKATWTFASGYKYQFGHCHDSEDWQNYLSFEYSIILYDELVQMEEEQYDQINTRLRSSDPLLRKMLKIRSMSNPLMSKQKGDNFSIKDPNWVRKRFVDPAPEGRTTLKKTIRMQDGTTRDHRSIYLPATLYDNPDPEFVKTYEFQLQKSKPHIRQALLYGNWYITAGSFYGDVWNKNLHVTRPFKIPKEWPKWRSMDWGFKLPGCVHWWAMDEDDNIFCFREMMFQGMQAKAVAEAIKQVEEGYGLVKNGKSILTGVADTQLWEDRGDSTKGKAQEMAEEGVNWTKAKKGPGSRLRNAELLYDRLADHQSGTTTPGVVFFESCVEAIKLIPAMGTSDKNSEEPADGNDDHPVDSVFYSMGHASHGRAGLGWRSADSDDIDDEEEKPKGNRGRWGYGSRVC